MQDAGTSSKSIYDLFSDKVWHRTFWQSVPVITVKKLFCSKSRGLSRAEPKPAVTQGFGPAQEL
jgi:hypothetical protein